MVKRLVACAIGCGLGGCGSFQDPEIVLDLRVISMTAAPPEQVVPLDLQHPPTSIDQLGLVPVYVCGLAIDPKLDPSQPVSWDMTVCGATNSERCDDDSRPSFQIATALSARGEICGVVPADAGLLVVLEDAIKNDPLDGFSGVDLVVSLHVTEGGQEVWGAKHVRYSPKVPADRVANHNPYLQYVDLLGVPAPPEGECIQVPQGFEAGLQPIEPDGVREQYVLPTFDGGEEHFTEVLSYQWLATSGSFGIGVTGGPRDASGSFPPTGNRWTAPTDHLGDETIWIVQRDERGGESWRQICATVIPPRP